MKINIREIKNPIIINKTKKEIEEFVKQYKKEIQDNREWKIPRGKIIFIRE